MRFIVSIFFAMILTLTTSLAEDNDTATTTNILPNAGTTSSSVDDFDLDGVNSGTGNLSNNSTHNGFTITCGTTVEGHCGRAFSGELESSHDMKVSASDTLIGIDGTVSSTTYTTTQNKLNGGIQLNSYFSVQNCEDGNSSFSCGSSTGANDSYNLHIKIKDSDGNTLSELTTTRLDDAGYYANSAKFHDNLVWNGTGAASYEWYWEGIDGSESTSELRGPNLLGAELLLDFPTDDYEAFTTEEIEELNEALNTVNLTENELWDVISGIEAVLEQEFALTGNLEEGTRLEISFEEGGLTLELASRETGAIVMETAMVQETFSSALEETPIETLKEEIVSMVQEETPFQEILEEAAPPAKMETVKEEETKVSKAPPGMTPAKEEEKEEVKEEQPIVKETREEVAKEESSSESSTEVSSASTSEQKKIQAKKALVKNLDRVMNKVDTDIKDIAKNLQIKNLIKLEAMTSEQASLDLYAKALFYQPKDIYLQQLNIFDNRQIYDNVNLASYIETDKVAIKANALHEINLKKQRLLIELEQLKNGKI